jgi:WD40 repeat protein
VSDGRGTVRLRNARTGRPARPPVVTGHAVTGLALSPDGATLAVTSRNGLQLWSTATGRRIGGPLPAAGPPAFSPDGRLVAAACTLAGQSLTREQWAGYAGTQPFQQVCPAS